MTRRRFRVVERVDHAHALDRLLRHAVEDRGRLHAHGFENRRRDVDDVMELGADAAPVLDPRRPRDDEAVARTAEVGRDLLRPLERRVGRMRPADGEMVVGVRPAELVHPAQDLAEVLRNVVGERHLVEQALRRALGAGAVVALDVDDESIVEIALFLDGVEDAAELVVDVRQRAREHLHHARVHLLAIGVERVPRLDLLRPRRERRVGGNDANLLLPRESLLAQLVPALVEPALELGDPFLRRVMRRVRSAGRVVLQPRLLRRHRMQQANARDGLVSHVPVEEIVLVVRRLDRLRAFEQCRRPLIRVGADEAVEVFEAERGGPQVERSGLARLPIRHVVVLAVPRGVVAVLLQHLGERAGALRHERVVPRVAGGELHDRAGRVAVVIAAGEQRGARRRAQRSGVELRVAKSRLGYTVHRRRGNGSSERARGAEADVIGQDEQDVRCAFGRAHRLREVRRGRPRRESDAPGKRRGERRQVGSGRRVGRAGLGIRRLRRCSRRPSEPEDHRYPEGEPPPIGFHCRALRMKIVTARTITCGALCGARSFRRAPNLGGERRLPAP